MNPTPLDTAPGGSELRQTVQLAAPLAVAFAGTQLLSVVDMVIAGRLGEGAMAAVGLGGACFFTVLIFPIGVMLGLDPLVSQALGRGDRALTHHHAAGAMRLARWLTLPAIGLSLAVLAVALTFADFDPTTRAQAWQYIGARALAALPTLIFVAQRSVLQAWGRVTPIAAAMVLGNAVNIPASALLALGDGALEWIGLPPVGLGSGLGPMGIGLATALVALCQAGWLSRAARALPDRPPQAPSAPPMAPMWRMGWPIGLQMGSEVSMFCITTMAMARFGETAVAAHQIATITASLTFTLFLGIGSATAVRVGLAVGGRDQPRARRAASTGLGLGLLLAVGTVSLFSLGGGWIAALFTDVGPVLALAVEFFVIAAVFQLADGTQSIAAGAMRGAGDTRASMLIGVAGYWVVAVPTGMTLAFGFDLGPHGLWYGLVVGLAIAAVAGTARALWITR